MRKHFWHLLDEANGGDGGAASGGAAPAAAAAGTAAAAGGAGTTPTAANGSAATPAAAATPSGAATPATAATAATPAAAAATPAKADWPENWQTLIAGDDKDELKQLGRYASPKAVWEKARALERRLSSGELKAALPKNPTEADLAAWRKDNGVPDKIDGYKLDLGEEKITKESKPVIDAFLKSAHAANMTNEQASAAVSSYLAIQKQEAQARLERDDADRGKALDAIAKEWGGALSRNKSLIGNALQIFPQAVRDQLMSARLPDGSALFNNVDVLRGFLAMEMQKNPAGIVAPAGGGDVGKTALEEYQVLQKFMRDNRDAYNKDTAKQGRVTELIGFLAEQGLIDNNGNVVQKKAA